MSIFDKITKRISNLSTIKFIIVMILSSYILFVPMLPILIPIMYFSMNNNMYVDLDMPNIFEISNIVTVIILAPLIETLLFQAIPIILLEKIIREKTLLIIVISGILFGLAHYPNIGVMLTTSIIGMLLTYSYYIYREKGKNAYMVVVLIHSGRNIIALLVKALIIMFS